MVFMAAKEYEASQQQGRKAVKDEAEVEGWSTAADC
jgi:hypothetical protein